MNLREKAGWQGMQARPKGSICRLFLCTSVLALVVFVRVSEASPPPVPLATTYQQGIALENYWISEKLDGVRAYWNGREFLSRNGNVYNAPDWFIAGFPSVPLDGELWMGRQRFAELSGAVRKGVPVPGEWRGIQFHVFDLPAPGPFYERYEQLVALIGKADTRYLALVTQTPASTHAALMADLDKIVAEGGEGLMLKRRDSLYEAGRSDDLMKVKTFADAEAVVVGHIPGKGRLQNMMGALQVELPSGRRFRIGTGFSDELRTRPPAPGTRITFKYYGFTATGLPRFASFLRVRDDEPKVTGLEP
ncbi:DNA ligase [uncultured Marinobacter sp.]|uniref:DNA ligase n=1 Tax=uncultured Marinobacter sp. TaxID=187379 RepID=UPI00262AF274|nr:DNA ligase [uncultured Marinobacter sp.]